MVRNLAMLVGAAFVAVLGWALFWTVQGLIVDPPTATAEAEFHKHPRELDIASNGPMGGFSKNTRQLQRGFQVYKEVCSACHSLKLVSFRDLKGIGYSDAEVKAIATQWAVEQPSTNPDTGEVATRKNLPSDHFPSPFANEIAARAANNNALPPDFSLITKARHDGPAYVYSLVTGYADQPAALLKKFPDLKTPTGLYYNPYFANLNIAMPPPLTQDGQVTYADGTAPTREQMAKDVSAFLVWTAEPKLEARHSTGWPVLAFLAILTFLAYGAYQNVWRGIKH